MSDHYKLLGISNLASQAELKSAYKKLAVQYHPDKTNGDPDKEELFKQINNAYQVLSNNYQRSNYDMMLRYSHQQPSAVPSYRPHSYHTPRKRRYAPVSSVSNFRATLYAFGIAFSVAIVFVTFNFAWHKYQNHQRNQLLQERRVVFDLARLAHQNEQNEVSLGLLDDLGIFKQEERDMQEYRDQLIKSIGALGDEYLQQGAFQKALDQYHLLEQFPLSQSINNMQKKAQAYEGVGDFDEAIALYQMMFLHGYQSFGFYYEIGRLYESKSDVQQALNYYQKGVSLMASSYERTIGKAYPLIINASMIPPKHYDLYMKVAQSQMALGQYQKAISSVAWTKEIWMDSLLQYRIEALCFGKIGDQVAMASSIAQARAIDASFLLE